MNQQQTLENTRIDKMNHYELLMLYVDLQYNNDGSLPMSATLKAIDLVRDEILERMEGSSNGSTNL